MYLAKNSLSQRISREKL
ncbi:MAG: hypothetical protein COS72_03980, partial [Candidatus Moranbacteria bacterium CG06_land_8_20_14_3_00_43_56]